MCCPPGAKGSLASAREIQTGPPVTISERDRLRDGIYRSLRQPWDLTARRNIDVEWWCVCARLVAALRLKLFPRHRGEGENGDTRCSLPKFFFISYQVMNFRAFKNNPAVR